jgi:hypothetical protein
MSSDFLHKLSIIFTDRPLNITDNRSLCNCLALLSFGPIPKLRVFQGSDRQRGPHSMKENYFACL